MSVANISVIIRFPLKANINPSQIGFTSWIRTEVGLLGKPCLSLMSLILRSYEKLLLVVTGQFIDLAYGFGIQFVLT